MHAIYYSRLDQPNRGRSPYKGYLHTIPQYDPEKIFLECVSNYYQNNQRIINLNELHKWHTINNKATCLREIPIASLWFTTFLSKELEKWGISLQNGWRQKFEKECSIRKDWFLGRGSGTMPIIPFVCSFRIGVFIYSRKCFKIFRG